MTDAPGSSEPQGNVLAKDLDGTFYIVPVEAMLQYAVNDAETLTAVTAGWEANERGEDVEAYDLGAYLKQKIWRCPPHINTAVAAVRG